MVKLGYSHTQCSTACKVVHKFTMNHNVQEQMFYQTKITYRDSSSKKETLS